MWNESHYETDELYERWGGEKVVMSPRSPRHESVQGTLVLLIKSFVLERRLGAVYSSNTAVYLEGETSNGFVIPDLTFVSRHNRQIVRANGIYGAPDLVVEVVSPGLADTRRDLIDKYAKYEQVGVKEYWLVDPIDGQIEIYALQGHTFEKMAASLVLQGLELKSETIFADDFGEDVDEQ